jgi:hypothetical protein
VLVNGLVHSRHSVVVASGLAGGAVASSVAVVLGGRGVGERFGASASFCSSRYPIVRGTQPKWLQLSRGVVVR